MSRELTDRLIHWGMNQQPIRAMILYSTRSSPKASVDALSDYDVILAITDIHPYWEDKTWLEDFGRVLVVYRNPIHPDDLYGLDTSAHIVQYENGTKIDFTLFSVDMLKRITADENLPEYLDIGYTILLDKDGLTNGLKSPTYRAHIPLPPVDAEYQDVVEEFFHETTYVAKHLWREDLVPAKSMLDGSIKVVLLRKMLEWRVEIDHDWAIKPGAHGKGLKKLVNKPIWTELEQTYVGADEEENWEALFRLIELFRSVATEVGDHLGFAYPVGLHGRAVRYLQRVKALERG